MAEPLSTHAVETQVQTSLLSSSMVVSPELQVPLGAAALVITLVPFTPLVPLVPIGPLGPGGPLAPAAFQEMRDEPERHVGLIEPT
jgi:hypothetical protein